MSYNNTTATATTFATALFPIVEDYPLFKELEKYPSIQRYYQVMHQLRSMHPRSFEDRVYLDTTTIPSQEKIDELVSMEPNLPGGSHLMQKLRLIVHDLIFLQKSDMIRGIASLLTEKERSQLFWKTEGKKGFSLSCPLIFIACLVPSHYHFEKQGHPISQETMEDGLPPILDLLLELGGHCEDIGFQEHVFEDKQKMEALFLPTRFFLELHKEIQSLEEEIRPKKKELELKDRLRFLQYSGLRDEQDETDYDSQEPEGGPAEPEILDRELKFFYLESLVRTKEFFHNKSKVFGLSDDFFMKFDEQVRILCESSGRSEDDIPTTSPSPLVRKLDLYVALNGVRSFFMDETSTYVVFSNLEDFLRRGQKLLFEEGVCSSFCEGTLNDVLVPRRDDRFECYGMFQVDSVLSWKKFSDFVKNKKS